MSAICNCFLEPKNYLSLMGRKPKIRAWKALTPQAAFHLSPISAWSSSEPLWKRAAQSSWKFICLDWAHEELDCDWWVLILNSYTSKFDWLSLALKLRKEYHKTLYCHLPYLTYMQSTSWEMPGWMKYKLQSRLPGETSTTSDTQMIPCKWHKVKMN